MEDLSLVRRLRDQRIPLPVCPLSNVCLRTVDTLADQVPPAMLDEDLIATVNSDDPAYFGGYVDANYEAVREHLGLDDRQLATLALNSFDACFVDDASRTRWQDEIRTTFARTAPRVVL